MKPKENNTAAAPCQTPSKTPDKRHQLQFLLLPNLKLLQQIYRSSVNFGTLKQICWRRKKFKKVPPRFELRLLDSESRVLTITPWNHTSPTLTQPILPSTVTMFCLLSHVLALPRASTSGPRWPNKADVLLLQRKGNPLESCRLCCFGVWFERLDEREKVEEETELEFHKGKMKTLSLSLLSDLWFSCNYRTDGWS